MGAFFLDCSEARPPFVSAPSACSAVNAYGAEIRKTRPAVIVSDDAVGVLPFKVIVPLTE